MSVTDDERIIRQFACSCCGRIRNLLIDQRLREAVELLEKAVAGGDHDNSLRQAKILASGALQDIHDDASEQRWYYVYRDATEAVCLALSNNLTVDDARRVAELANNAWSLAQEK